MLFALVNSEKKRAKKGLSGTCPVCQESLVPRCGHYVVHHWAHKRGSDCDSWAEGETEWHLGWKNRFDPKFQEVVIKNDTTGEVHRADIRTPNGMVIELQHSPIRDEEVSERTAFYGKMFWIVDGKNFGFVEPDFFLGLSLMPGGSVLCEFGYYGRSSFFQKWIKVNAPVFIDFGKSKVFWLKAYDQQSRKGIVQLVDREDLIERNGGIVPPKPDEAE